MGPVDTGFAFVIPDSLKEATSGSGRSFESSAGSRESNHNLALERPGKALTRAGFESSSLSSPASGSSSLWLERQLAKLEAAGSSPVFRIKRPWPNGKAHG